MKAILATVTAAALAVSLVLGAAAPASAATIYFGSPGYNNFESHGDYAYYNNHRGYRRQQPGYRYYQGYWFPPAAFLGLFLGTVLHGARTSTHTQWCYDHYRSYRASDNTFQPYHGPRQQCVSPY
ncbi:MAG: BA14K family protein [Devosia sp.]|nr:BA14K family protein [Devosia sp.]